jgi:predicted nucleic acid-binding protein
MTAERFSLDTNILVYAADLDAGFRHDRACEIVEHAARRSCVLTLQALAEFFHAVTRKGIVPRDEAAQQVRDWLELFPVEAADADALRLALDASSGGRFGFWDSLLLAAAGQAGCAAVVSEDMQSGARLGPVRVVAPFANGGIAPEAARLLGLSANRGKNPKRGGGKPARTR